MENFIYNIYDKLHLIFLKNERLSLLSLGGIMLLAIVGMGAVSLAMLNTKATKGYKLNELENERQALITDLEISDTLILRAQSMKNIEQSTTQMVKAGSEDIYYVLPASAVAVKE